MNRELFRNKRALALIGAIVVALLCVAIFSSTTPKKNPAAGEQQDKVLINGWLPVQTSHYKITYTFDQTKREYYYQITLYAIINRPSEHDSYIAQLKQYKQEALAYIKLKGGDPSKMVINYLPPDAASL